MRRLTLAAVFPRRVFVFGERCVKVLWDNQVGQLMKLAKRAAWCAVLFAVTALVSHVDQSARTRPALRWVRDWPRGWWFDC